MTLYGNDNTIHRTEHVEVEVDDDGSVVAVWFRCIQLAFTQHQAGDSRAAEMRPVNGVKITAVQVSDS